MTGGKRCVRSASAFLVQQGLAVSVSSSDTVIPRRVITGQSSTAVFTLTRGNKPPDLSPVLTQLPSPPSLQKHPPAPRYPQLGWFNGQRTFPRVKLNCPAASPRAQAPGERSSADTRALTHHSTLPREEDSLCGRTPLPPAPALQPQLCTAPARGISSAAPAPLL